MGMPILLFPIFERFSIELAQVLTGDSQVEQTLSRLFHISSFIDRQGDLYAIRYPSYRAYLQHKAETT